MEGGFKFDRDESSDIVRYCIHGLVFAVLMFVITIAWVFLLPILAIFGSIFGIIIGLGILVMVHGFINTEIMKWLWDADMQQDWKTYLMHGTGLFLLLLVASIPSMVMNYLAPSWITTIIMFVIYVPIDGYLAKWTGSNFENVIYVEPDVSMYHDF